MTARSSELKALIRGAKRRAVNRNIPFSITAADIHVPDYCPVLGIRLERNVGGVAQHDASPTLDRIDPAKGYVPGNVIVISSRANAMKSIGNADELERVASFVRQLTA